MITRKVTYTGEHKEKMEKILESLVNEAEYVGEDGAMVCNAPTKAKALKLFKKRVTEDAGEAEAADMNIKDVGGVPIFLVEEENEDHRHLVADGAEWYVDWSGKTVSDYIIYGLNF